ncbi:MAG: plastocyanin/azurin family copper-binding protein [Myxococcota bacterium]
METKNDKMDRRSSLKVMAVSAGGLWLAACEQGSKPAAKAEKPKEMAKKPTDEKPAADKAASKPASKPEDGAADEAAAGGGETVKVALEVGDGLAYNIKKIEVAAGSTVEVTINHTGKMAASAMGHNFVLLKQGTDMGAFASAAISAQATNYIPDGMKDQVIANTKVVGGGESDTISFSAPEKGEYTYLCSFPGHYLQMNGKFIVN